MLTSIALLLAISLVTARAMFEQNLRQPEVIVPGSLATPRAAGPTTMLLLDLAMCLPAILILLRRTINPNWRLRFHLSSILFVAVSLLAGASCFWASDKFAAAVTSANFIAAAAILWAMIQLVRSWVNLRLVAAACFGLLLVYIAKGAIYRLIDWPDEMQYFQQHRAEVLQQRGYEPGSFAANQYEAKIHMGEEFGFFTSPNTLGAMIVMLGVVGAGAAIQRIVDHDEPGWAVAIIIGLCLAAIVAYFTYSITAAVTPLLAAAFIALSPWMARRARRFYFVGVAIVLLGTAMLIGHGLVHGSLVIRNLTVRWQYWIGAMRIFLRHPILGVGWSSFGEYYLRARVPVATEEVRDPHNFVVRAFVELGIIGGLLMVAWLARVWWEMTTSDDVSEPAHSATGTSSLFGLIFAICGIGTLVSIFASIDFTISESGIGGYAVLELLQRLLFFAVLLLGFAIILLKSSAKPVADDRPAPWLLCATAAGIAVFLIHNLIDFSLFEPGPMCVFAMLVGAVLGMREQSQRMKEKSFRRLATVSLILVVLIWLASAIGVVAPIAASEQIAQESDSEIRAGRISIGADDLRKAFEDLWIPNSDYAFRAAVAMRQAGGPIADAEAMLQRAASVDPIRPQNYRALADFELRQPVPDQPKVIANYQTAVALDPNDLALRKDLADALARFGQTSRAIEEYQEILRRNDLLPEKEPKRMSATQVQLIQDRINRLKE